MKRCVFGSLLLVGALVGCGGQATKEDEDPKLIAGPTEVALLVRARADVNPNDLGEPTPVDLKVYQLKSETEFTRASFDDLWTDAKGALVDSLSGAEKVISCAPGDGVEQPIELDIKLDAGVEFIGLMGCFQGRREGAERRKLCLAKAKIKGKVFELTGYEIVVVDAELGSAESDSGAEPDEQDPPAGEHDSGN